MNIFCIEVKYINPVYIFLLIKLSGILVEDYRLLVIFECLQHLGFAIQKLIHILFFHSFHRYFYLS